MASGSSNAPVRRGTPSPPVACSAPACPKCGAPTGPTHDFGQYGASPIWKCTVCDGWLHRSLEPNVPVRRGTPSPQSDGSACPDCGWLVRRIQDDGSARMEHAFNCRRNQPNTDLSGGEAVRSK
jgi:hypothetical protein